MRKCFMVDQIDRKEFLSSLMIANYHHKQKEIKKIIDDIDKDLEENKKNYKDLIKEAKFDYKQKINSIKKSYKEEAQEMEQDHDLELDIFKYKKHLVIGG